MKHVLMVGVLVVAGAVAVGCSDVQGQRGR